MFLGVSRAKDTTGICFIAEIQSDITYFSLAYWRGSKKLIGGGDTLEAMKRAGVSEAEVSHVSTGGGPTLRFLAGNEMPRIEVLN